MQLYVLFLLSLQEWPVFWDGAESAGVVGLLNGLYHVSDGRLYNYLHRNGRNGGGNMDRSSAGNSKTRALLDFILVIKVIPGRCRKSIPDCPCQQ